MKGLESDATLAPSCTRGLTAAAPTRHRYRMVWAEGMGRRGGGGGEDLDMGGWRVGGWGRDNPMTA